ncbi:unnamed protein product [Didymodactylos carnosus]|uniref:NAD(P)(+)--arginine ADP-ribosyltransferase n=1 Tax=Didymodactylos carnosus TaxID=1234261 RepID=A0A814VJS4_9BILA|nr:unnamed protein product [Didymodactylos carnosus]CAF3954174.1 unnamed protein product [Didymodactylos carnosus]
MLPSPYDTKKEMIVGIPDINEEYYQCLLHIANQIDLRSTTQTRILNDEILLINSILKYILLNIRYGDNSDKHRSLLRASHIPDICLHVLNSEYESMCINSFFVLSHLEDDTTLKDTDNARKLIEFYFYYLKKKFPFCIGNEIFLIEDFLLGLLTLATNDVIKDMIAEYNCIQLLVQLAQKKPAVYKIIWSLSFHRTIRIQLNTNKFFSAHLLDNNIYSNDVCQALRAMLLNLDYKKHEWNKNWKINNSEIILRSSRVSHNWKKFDAVFSYSNRDRDECVRMKNILCENGYRLWIAQDTKDERSVARIITAFQTIKRLIVCISDGFERDNYCMSVLRHAFSNGIAIEPIILQNDYRPRQFVSISLPQILIKNFSKFHMNMIKVLKSKEFPQEGLSILQKIKLNRENYHENNETIHPYEKQELNDTEEATDTMVGISVMERPPPSDLYRACRSNAIDKVYEYLKTASVDEINQIQSNGSTALHIASYHGHNEIVKLLLEKGASPSIRNQIYGLTAFDEARTNQTEDLFSPNSRFSDQLHSDLFDWSIIIIDPAEKHKELRQFLTSCTLYREVLLKLRNRYISQWFQLEREEIESYFIQAEEESDPTYLIKAYTSKTMFHKVLNNHLALYSERYLDPSMSYEDDNSFISCALDIVSIIVNRPEFDPYYCTGICYRGMLLTRNDLPKYIIGHRVMNKSFISTSRSRQVAEIYSGAEQQNYLRQTPDNRPIQISTFCTYIIRNKRTALNIKSLSLFEDEEEVLIVPFSAFEVTEVKQYHHSKNARIMVELEFTECNES